MTSEQEFFAIIYVDCGVVDPAVYAAAITCGFSREHALELATDTDEFIYGVHSRVRKISLCI